jgi:hypothetical protein
MAEASFRELLPELYCSEITTFWRSSNTTRGYQYPLFSSKFLTSFSFLKKTPFVSA